MEHPEHPTSHIVKTPHAVWVTNELHEVHSGLAVDDACDEVRRQVRSDVVALKGRVGCVEAAHVWQERRPHTLEFRTRRRRSNWRKQQPRWRDHVQAMITTKASWFLVPVIVRARRRHERTHPSPVHWT